MATVLDRPAADPAQRPAAISPEEWAVRVDLAAFYRISAIHDYDDFLYTHVTARVPGPDAHFLINPFGLAFDEITASSLVKVDLDGNVIGGEGEYGINYAGYVIHSAIHAARPDATGSRISTPATAWALRPTRKACCRSRSARSTSSRAWAITITKAWRSILTSASGW
jgi:ribulose-5-phosphate 4-epimerase/fuculose-1-phosphate aldolase